MEDATPDLTSDHDEDDWGEKNKEKLEEESSESELSDEQEEIRRSGRIANVIPGRRKSLRTKKKVEKKVRKRCFVFKVSNSF